MGEVTSRVKGELRSTHTGIDQLRASALPGVYAIFLSMPKTLGRFPVADDGMIYVGISGNLAEREFDTHFDSDGSAFSTLRRSLGGILKTDLDLQARPRSPGRSESNFRCYRFEPAGDVRLSGWMRANLEVGVCPVSSPEEVEKALTRELQPLLNLTGVPILGGRRLRRFARHAQTRREPHGRRGLMRLHRTRQGLACLPSALSAAAGPPTVGSTRPDLGSPAGVVSQIPLSPAPRCHSIHLVHQAALPTGKGSGGIGHR
jgi:hypothetical protein